MEVYKHHTIIFTNRKPMRQWTLQSVHASVCVCVRERERGNQDGKSITDGENFTLDK